MGKAKVLIVSNRLPVNLVERGGKVIAERSIGGVATALDAVAKRFRASWIGWTGQRRVLADKDLESSGLARRYLPVQAGDRLVRGFYDHFSNRFLWPTMHGKRVDYSPTEEDWAAYQSMNRRFAAAVAEAAKPDDIIWVNDYHLMLVPAYLREMGVTNRIGFFLHVPFPRSGFWMRRPYARTLAESLAVSDVVGMQTNRDVQEFRAYMSAIGVRPQGLLRAFPIGVDYEAYRRAAKQPVVQRLGQNIKKAISGKKVIFSLSRMDYTKGILTQLHAVRRLLTGHKQREGLVYKLVVAPSRENLPEYTRLSKQITDMVDDINNSLGTADWQPIDYEHRTIDFDEVTAWYTVADTLLLLPDADGMNLIAKEYVAARQDNNGMAVLTTTMGAAEQLGRALLVPPGDPSAAASALEQALKMRPAERPQRWQRLRAAVRDQDIFWWADSFVAAVAASSGKA